MSFQHLYPGTIPKITLTPSERSLWLVDYTSRVTNEPDCPPKYCAPEPTGDELLDEMLELVAYREHKHISDEWYANKERLKIMMDGLRAGLYSTRQAYKVKTYTATQPTI